MMHVIYFNGLGLSDFYFFTKAIS